MKVVATSALLSLAALASSAAAQQLPNGVKIYGVNYDRRQAPDWSPNLCKTRDQVFKDMEVIKQFSDRVRVYSLSDGACATADVLEAAGDNLEVALAIWPGSDSGMATQLDRLRSLLNAKLSDGRSLTRNVKEMYVGSEAIYRKDYTAAKAIDYLNQARAVLTQYGRSDIKVTIADVVDSYYQNSAVLQAVDFVSINQFSFWEKVDVTEGMITMLDRIRSIRRQAADAGKAVVISETGWSSGGSDPAASDATIANQKAFFQNFYQQATAQGLAYYWFAAFESLWMKDVANTSTVEYHFGMLNEDNRQFKESFTNLDLTPRTQFTFQSTSGRMLAETYNPDRIEEVTGVEMIDSSSDKLTALRYQWFFDQSKGQIRSLNSDRCLDAYEAWNGGTVHTYRCIETEPNQKWTYDATSKQLKHASHVGFCLDNDPNQNYKLQLWGCSDNNANQQYDTSIPAVESKTSHVYTKASKTPGQLVQLVRVDSEQIGYGIGAQAAGAEWTFDASSGMLQSANSQYCLDAYEGWNGGRVHVWSCNTQEPNQKWSYDSSSGQFKHQTHAGFCLDADQNNNVIHLWTCMSSNDNQVWRQVSSSAKAVQITGSDKSVVEFITQDTQQLTAAASKDSQVWFWNSFENSISSKWNGECLDAYEAWDGGRVHTWGCIATEGNQKWSYDSGMIKHKTHQGFCLAYKSAADKTLTLKTCSSSDTTQKFTFATL